MKAVKWVMLALMMIAAAALAFTPYNQDYERKTVNGFEIMKGERPAIDLNKVPADAYEPGKLTVKFKDGYEAKSSERFIKPSTKGFVEIGIASVDQVNKSVSAKQFDRKFYSLLEIPEGTIHSVAKFKDRHEAWGFHRVYEIEIPLDQDVIAAVKQYAALPEVEYAEPVYKKAISKPLGVRDVTDEATNIKGSEDPKWSPSDTYLSPNQWHYNNYGQSISGYDGTIVGVPGVDVRAISAWDIEKGNPLFVTAIIDQGIDYDHSDIAANMWSGRGWNFTNNSSTINPGDHGSHVAGVVSGVSNNGIGIAGLAGGDGTAGTGSKVMSCQVFDTSSGGFAEAMIWAADQGASISQNSWGYTSAGYYEQTVLDAIDYFNANGGQDGGLQGGITIFAAGNNGTDAEWYPGYYNGSMAVASINNNGQKSSFSNFGTWIDISAPGGGIYSLNGTGGYMSMDGTSMACPHVSGAAAMIVANSEGVLTAADLRTILESSVWDVYAYNSSYTGKLGTGALDASAALVLTQEYLGGVPGPSNFAASTVSQSQIDLSWTLNEFNDNVLVAWALDGEVIGDPVDGTTYSVGQTLPGGGSVLYYNNGTTYSHTGLTSGTSYDYKIWARAMAERQDNQGEWYQIGTYSGSRSTGGTTDYGTFYLPFSENFNASASLPGGWALVDNQGSGQLWSFGTHASGLSGADGNYAFLNSDAYGSGSSQNADLVTPLIDMSGYTGITLSFNHYFLEYTGSSAALSYSINGGSSWTVIDTWTATTANPASFNQTITALDNQPNVKIKWNYTGSWGYYWDVDDVSITGTSGTTPPSTPTLVSPANGTNTTSKRPVFDWSDVTGATSYTIQVDNNADFNSPEIQESPTVSNYTPGADLANGTYYWRVLATNTSGSSSYTTAWSVVVQAPEPNIVLSVASINTTAAPEATDTDSFDIINNGDADLTYDITQAYTSKSAKADITVHSNDFSTFPGTGYTNSGFTDAGGYPYASGSPQGTQVSMTSGTFDGTVCSQLYLDFDQAFIFATGSSISVEYYDGSSWNQVYSASASTNASQHIELPTIAANMQIRFSGTLEKTTGAGGVTSSWEFDNIVVSGPELYSYSWLVINSATSGTVVPAGSNTINLTCDAAGLAEGTYTADITVASNDPDTPSSVIPVTFNVAQAAVIPGTPANVVTSISVTDLVIDWDVSADATSYDVYSSNDPYSGFAFEANVGTNQYVVPYTDSKKFYYIVSKNVTK